MKAQQHIFLSQINHVLYLYYYVVIIYLQPTKAGSAVNETGYERENSIFRGKNWIMIVTNFYAHVTDT